jgi:DNA-binding HxlR family transcriptional regulator
MSANARHDRIRERGARILDLFRRRSREAMRFQELLDSKTCRNERQLSLVLKLLVSEGKLERMRISYKHVEYRLTEDSTEALKLLDIWERPLVKWMAENMFKGFANMESKPPGSIEDQLSAFFASAGMIIFSRMFQNKIKEQDVDLAELAGEVADEKLNELLKGYQLKKETIERLVEILEALSDPKRLADPILQSALAHVHSERDREFKETIRIIEEKKSVTGSELQRILSKRLNT